MQGIVRCISKMMNVLEKLVFALLGVATSGKFIMTHMN